MSGITMNAPAAPSLLPDCGFLSQPWEGDAARFASRRLRSSVAVISAYGLIDASNADTLTQYALGHLMRCRGLILDLRSLDFFGTEGFSALHRVSVCCARGGIGWAVVAGEAVSRVLRISDPQGLLPAAGTVEAATAIVQDQLTVYHSPSRAAGTPDNPRDANARRAWSLAVHSRSREQRTLTEAIAKLDY
jgi:anti-anti-sigma factor